MSIRLLAAIGAVAIATSPLAAQEAVPAPAKPFTAEETSRYMALGKRATDHFISGHADSLLAMMSPEAQEGVGGLDGVRRMMDQIAERAGVVLNVVDQKMTRREGRPQFWWEAEFSEFTEQPLVIRWVFGEDDLITGAGINPKSAARADPEG